MNQHLYLQGHSQQPNRETSFFSCFNCFPQPQQAECYVTDKPVFLKNAKNNYLYPSTITQEDKRYAGQSNHPNSMHESRRSNINDNKKDAISLRRSRRVSTSNPQTVFSPEVPQFTEHFLREGKYLTPHNLIMQPTICNLQSSRLSTPQALISNRSTIVPQNTNRSQTPKPTIAFSYHVSPPTNSSIANIAPKQVKQNIRMSSPFQLTESYLQNSEASFGKELQPTSQKLSQIYASKEMLESLQLDMKKVSSTSKQSSKLRKNGNFGSGKLHFQVRQTISIRQPQEEDIHESIVLSHKQFQHYSVPTNNLLKPITQSELQLQSFIGGDPRNR